jgi:hypothetical protein
MMKYTSDLFQLKVLVNNKPVQEYHKGERTFVEGRQGSRFMLELTNLTHRRLLVHPTVDGLSVMTGKEASKNDNTEGYVLMPHQFLKIPGWRLDNDTVADFFFAGAGSSYAEKTGKPRNKGVIGCAVWEGKQIEQPLCRSRSSWNSAFNEGGLPEHNDGSGEVKCSANLNFSAETLAQMNEISGSDVLPVGGITPVMSCAMPSCCEDEHSGDIQLDSSLSTERHSKSATKGPGGQSRNRVTRSVPTQNLGTGFGDKTTHQVKEVTFVPQTTEPILIAAIYYDDYEGLRSRGIKLRRRNAVQPGIPDPFPKVTGCRPPNGWRG